MEAENKVPSPIGDDSGKYNNKVQTSVAETQTENDDINSIKKVNSQV